VEIEIVAAGVALENLRKDRDEGGEEEEAGADEASEGSIVVFTGLQNFHNAPLEWPSFIQQ